jgi:hypothetical protein
MSDTETEPGLGDVNAASESVDVSAASESGDVSAAPGTGDTSQLESSSLPESVGAPVPLENSLNCTPFFAKDYANFNQFLLTRDGNHEEQLQKLYSDGSLSIVTFSMFSDSEAFDEKMVNQLEIASLGSAHNPTHISTLKKILKNQNMSNYELFRRGFLKIATTQTNNKPESKYLILTINAKKSINKNAIVQYGGAVEFDSTPSISFHDVGDTPDKGHMLFLTSKGKAEVNQKAVDQRIAEPYTGFTAARAITLQVTIPSSDPSGKSKDVVTTQFVSDDVKQQAEQDVKRYYEDLDKYESEEIDKFLKDPMSYIQGVPPTKPNLLGDLLNVSPVIRDDIIEKLFKILLNDTNVTRENMILAVISVEEGNIVLRVYYYTGGGKFYNIERVESHGTLQLGDNSKASLTDFTKYSSNTFLCIDFGTMTIRKCIYLSNDVEEFFNGLTQQKELLEPKIKVLETEIEGLKTELVETQSQFENRRSSDAYKNTSLFGRMSSASDSEYNIFKTDLLTKIDGIQTTITTKSGELVRLTKNLTKLQSMFTNPMKIQITRSSYIKDEFIHKTPSFSLDDVVQTCRSSSGSGNATALFNSQGGNSNKRPTKKSRKIHTKKSRKRPTKKSRKH